MSGQYEWLSGQTSRPRPLPEHELVPMQQANAVAVERGAEEARQQSSAEVEAEHRRELKADADQSLENILALLDRQIKDAASSVRARADSLP